MNQIAQSPSKISRLWSRLPILPRAILSGFLVSTIGVAAWSAALNLLPFLLSIFIMIILLRAYCRYLSGSWGSKASIESRRTRFRSTELSARVWKWGLIEAVLFVIIIQSSFVITFRLVNIPSGYTSAYPIIETVPKWLAWILVIMSSVVAGICEETGFRGYMQVPLEKRYGPTIGITVVSIVFTVIHLNKVWAAPIIPNIFYASVLLGVLAFRSGSLIPGIIGHSILDIFDYSFWWTNLVSRKVRPTIFKAGLDQHFIIWAFVFAAFTIAFFWIIDRLKFAKDEVSSGELKK